jgi:hypothetical protein
MIGTSCEGSEAITLQNEIEKLCGPSGNSNRLEINLPYYQCDFSESNQFGNSPIFLIVNNKEPYCASFNDTSNLYMLNRISIMTRITYSTDFVSGSFDISATTLRTSKTIKVTGTFSHLPKDF